MLRHNKKDTQCNQEYWLNEQVSKLTREVMALTQSCKIKDQAIYSLMNELIELSDSSSD